MDTHAAQRIISLIEEAGAEMRSCAARGEQIESRPQRKFAVHIATRGAPYKMIVFADSSVDALLIAMESVFLDFKSVPGVTFSAKVSPVESLE